MDTINIFHSEKYSSKQPPIPEIGVRAVMKLTPKEQMFVLEGYLAEWIALQKIHQDSTDAFKKSLMEVWFKRRYAGMEKLANAMNVTFEIEEEICH